jgi:chromate transport protein ChrA
MASRSEAVPGDAAVVVGWLVAGVVELVDAGTSVVATSAAVVVVVSTDVAEHADSNRVVVSRAVSRRKAS